MWGLGNRANSGQQRTFVGAEWKFNNQSDQRNTESAVDAKAGAGEHDSNAAAGYDAVAEHESGHAFGKFDPAGKYAGDYADAEFGDDESFEHVC